MLPIIVFVEVNHAKKCYANTSSTMNDGLQFNVLAATLGSHIKTSLSNLPEMFVLIHI